MNGFVQSTTQQLLMFDDDLVGRSITSVKILSADKAWILFKFGSGRERIGVTHFDELSH